MFVISVATLTSKPFFVFKPFEIAQFATFRYVDALWITHGSDCGATLSKQAETRKGGLNASNAVRKLLNISAELLAQRQGCSILAAWVSAV